MDNVAVAAVVVFSLTFCWPDKFATCTCGINFPAVVAATAKGARKAASGRGS